MYGVVRFLDTALLPASSPEDYPKIIKSGIDEEHQHHKSPEITGPSGIATLLHDIGIPQLLERLFDTTGTEEFDLHISTKEEYILDLYVKRYGFDVEFGFLNSYAAERWPEPGVRYRIVPEPAGSPYRIGKWVPVSTSDYGSPSSWGGPGMVVRGVGTKIAKGIWFHQIFRQPNIEVSWTEMTKADEDELEVLLKERAERLALYTKKENEEHEKLEAMFENRPDLDLSMYLYHRSRMVCRADCGEKNPRLACSKCKIARYCGLSCQSEDWKYHKTYCGNELDIPKEYTQVYREVQREPNA